MMKAARPEPGEGPRPDDLRVTTHCLPHFLRYGPYGNLRNCFSS